jgi:hypothetical protein
LKRARHNPSTLIKFLVVVIIVALPSRSIPESTLKRGKEGDHWSLQPLAPVTPPSIENGSWWRTPVDAFILKKLKDQSMQPSVLADKRTLIRRAFFDLIGLPPTPAQVDAFLADSSANAFERIIDGLLDRPEYGERWARHWLDVAHFAETHGHDQDRPRTNAWPYRDCVIESFNADKPYARFVEEQIAGDVLYPDDPQATVAMGFLATGPWDESSLRDIREDSIDRQIARYIDRDDIVTTVMNTFVSTTVQCARCHDHKFDPVSQREYYNLQAVFAGTEKGNRYYDPDPELHRKRQRLLKKQKDLEAPSPALQLELVSGDFSRRVRAWESSVTANSWKVLEPVSCASSNGSTLKIEKDHSVSSSGKRPETDTYTILAPGTAGTGVRVELLTDESLPKRGPGRQDNGNLHLTDFKVYAVHSDSSLSEIPLRNAIADFNQDGWEITQAIDDDPKTAWGIFPQVGKTHQAVFEFAGQTLDAEQYQFVLAQDHGGGHLIGRLRLSITASTPPLRINPVPDEIVAIVQTGHPRRTEEQKLGLALYVAREDLARGLAALPPAHLVYAGAHDFVQDASFKPLDKPREVRLLKRGDINKPEDLATPGALNCVPGLSGEFPDDSSEGARRAALARWITDPRNALTWRSIVNRVWHYHFGRGLVNTPNDFGRMGGTPSHPELLDWLANWFLENGGSFKKLHKLIMTSAVYQQSSRDNPKYSAIDADNVYLWRMNRARLEAENVRDVILAVSGTLDPKMGGPSAQQFNMSPGIHVTPKVDYASFDFDKPEMRRRSIYRFVFRTLPDPFMDSLDCPDSSQLTAARNTSVTVSQALAMLNDQFVTRYSEHFAERLEHDCPGDLDGQIGLGVELTFGRPVRSDELSRYRTFVQKDGLPNFCRVLFNANEFMFIN